MFIEFKRGFEMKLRELSIIQYQNVSEKSHISRLWLSSESFKRQLGHIAANNFQILSMDEAVNHMEGKNRVKGMRPISLTFDNYEDNAWNINDIPEDLVQRHTIK